MRGCQSGETGVASRTVSSNSRVAQPTAALEYTTRTARDRPEAATVYRTAGRDLDLQTLDVARALTTNRERRRVGSVGVSCDCCRVRSRSAVGLTAPQTCTSVPLGPSAIGRVDTLRYATLVSRLDAPDDPSSARRVCERAEIDLCP